MSPEEQKAQLLRTIAAIPSSTRAETTRRRAHWLAAGLIATASIFLLAGGTRLEPRPPALAATTALGAAGIAFLTLVAALNRGRSMLGPSRRRLALVILLVPPALFLLKLAVSAAYPEMTVAWPLRPGFRCLGWSLAFSVGPLAALLAIRRRSDPTHPVIAAAAIGVAVGALSWLFVDLWCPVAHPRHLLLGHVLPLALVTASATALGARLLKL
jgi:hypothetical protein